jgi:hypothetical protein
MGGAHPQRTFLKQPIMKKDPFLSIHKSKQSKDFYRIVKWTGVHPNTVVETIKDNMTYGEAVYIKNQILNNNHGDN